MTLPWKPLRKERGIFLKNPASTTSWTCSSLSASIEIFACQDFVREQSKFHTWYLGLSAQPLAQVGWNKGEAPCSLLSPWNGG